MTAAWMAAAAALVIAGSEPAPEGAATPAPSPSPSASPSPPAEATPVAGPSDCATKLVVVHAVERALQECQQRGEACENERAALESSRAAAAGCEGMPPAVAVPTPAPAASTQASFAAGTTDGLVDAANESTFAWGAGGFGGGLLLPPVGCIGVTVGAHVTEPRIPEGAAAEPERDPQYVAGYRDAYTREIKSRRARAAVVGGTIGMTITLLAISFLAPRLDRNGDDASGSLTPGLGTGMRF